MSKRVWHVVVRGKWGGVRTLPVHASSDKTARREAQPLMRSDESIQSTYDTKETA